MRRLALTLIEVLVVMTIIAVLVGLLIPTIGYARNLAHGFDTAQRIEAIARALGGVAESGAGRAQLLQEQAGLGGVLDFAPLKAVMQAAQANASAMPTDAQADFVQMAGSTWVQQRAIVQSREDILEAMPPKAGGVAASWYATTWPWHWPASDWEGSTPGSIPPVLRFPWGRPGLRLDGTQCDPSRPAADVVAKVSELTLQRWEGKISGIDNETITDVPNAWVARGDQSGSLSFLADANQTAPVTNLAAVRSDGSPAVLPGTNLPVTANGAVPFDLGQTSPLRTIQLLREAGVIGLGEEGKYRTDRSPSRPWNDSWGNPLIIGYVLFQPERCRRTKTGDLRRAYLLQACTQQYGFNRALYAAVGSAGPELHSSIKKTWTAADDAIALRDYWFQIRAGAAAHEWTEDSFGQTPPWVGVRRRWGKYQGSDVHCVLGAPFAIR
ncbi:MAG: prepilin-type N-terminal cleavage/methylation domain-containing protein [Planctomycetes bacterium]|nr:prepilin-type N-terminal cleavage/methylation domain-containing protein [Planctomycetota bacterium]